MRQEGLRPRGARPLSARRRQQTSPGGRQDAEEGIGWRGSGRAGAPQLFGKALLATRAATRRCRASAGRTHVWPPRSSPLNPCLLVALFFAPSRTPKSFQTGLRAFGRTRTENTQLHEVPRTLAGKPRRIGDMEELCKVLPSPCNRGCETRPLFDLLVAAGGASGSIKNTQRPRAGNIRMREDLRAVRGVRESPTKLL